MVQNLTIEDLPIAIGNTLAPGDAVYFCGLGPECSRQTGASKSAATSLFWLRCAVVLPYGADLKFPFLGGQYPEESRLARSFVREAAASFSKWMDKQVFYASWLFSLELFLRSQACLCDEPPPYLKEGSAGS